MYDDAIRIPQGATVSFGPSHDPGTGCPCTGVGEPPGPCFYAGMAVSYFAEPHSGDRRETGPWHEE